MKYFLIFLIAAIGIVKSSPPCSYNKKDAVFILDASQSISKPDFKLAKEFIVKMISFMKSINTDNRIAFIVFGDDAKIIFNFDKHKKVEDMIKDVMSMDNTNGLTAIGKALKLTLEELVPSMRKEVEKIVILFTDGTNNIFPSPYAYADRLKDSFVQILTIGVGSDINTKELERIASPNMATSVKDFYGLLEKMKEIVHHMCVIVDPVPNEPCKSKQQDLVILFDSSASISHSDYEIGKRFLKNMLKQLDIGPDKTRVALLSFSNKIRFDLNFHETDKTKIFAIINNLKKFGSTTAIGLALQETYVKLKPKQRSNVPFNILLITDGFNNVHPRPLAIAEILKKHGANIISLGVGNRININELKAISSNDKVLTTSSYNRLAANLKTVLKVVTCG